MCLDMCVCAFNFIYEHVWNHNIFEWLFGLFMVGSPCCVSVVTFAKNSAWNGSAFVCLLTCWVPRQQKPKKLKMKINILPTWTFLKLFILLAPEILEVETKLLEGCLKSSWFRAWEIQLLSETHAWHVWWTCFWSRTNNDLKACMAVASDHQDMWGSSRSWTSHRRLGLQWNERCTPVETYSALKRLACFFCLSKWSCIRTICPAILWAICAWD